MLEEAYRRVRSCVQRESIRRAVVEAIVAMKGNTDVVEA